MIAEFTIKYKAKEGRTTKIVSLNQYKSLHWQALKKKLDPLKLEFTNLIKKCNPPRLRWMELRIEHNINFDLDNIAGTIKPFVDCLRAKEIIPEDNKKFWSYLSISYNPEVEKNYLYFTITGEILG